MNGTLYACIVTCIVCKSNLHPYRVDSRDSDEESPVSDWVATVFPNPTTTTSRGDTIFFELLQLSNRFL